MKDEDFRNYFEQFGEIDDCVVSTLPTSPASACCSYSVATLNGIAVFNC